VPPVRNWLASKVTTSDLAQMKPSTLLFNTSCAQLIESVALLLLANVVGTPHLGCVKQKGYELYFLDALRNE
jgi:phosphoglycerate dehydrogenase-like enzyme